VKLPGAIRVPADDVSSRLREIPRDRPVVAYCT
jgi:rhodanese-related sulfurtransferase